MLTNIGIYRSTQNKWILGVCGGVAEKFNVNPLWVRLGVVAVAILPAGLGIPPMALIYVALAVLLPKRVDAPIDSV
jgi:phage shock protein C